MCNRFNAEDVARHGLEPDPDAPTRIIHPPLSIDVAVTLQTIIDAAQACAKVARMLESGDVVYGHARSIGNDRGAFLATGEDVRDAFLRVTLQSGFEAFWPIAKLMPEASNGTFARYDW